MLLWLLCTAVLALAWAHRRARAPRRPTLSKSAPRRAGSASLPPPAATVTTLARGTFPNARYVDALRSLPTAPDLLFARLRTLVNAAPVFRRDARAPLAAVWAAPSLTRDKYSSLHAVQHPSLLGAAGAFSTDVVALYSDDPNKTPLAGVAEEALLMSDLFKAKLLPLSVSATNGLSPAAVTTALATHSPRALHIASHASAAAVSEVVAGMDTRLKLLFLNSCHGVDVAQAVLRSGRVDNVVCWTTDVDDAAAALFSLLFYRACDANGWDVEASFDATSRQIAAVYHLLDPNATHDGNSRRAGVPVLLSARKADGAQPDADPATPPPAVFDEPAAAAPAAAAAAAAVSKPPVATALKVETRAGVFCVLNVESSWADVAQRAGGVAALTYTDADGDVVEVCDDTGLKAAVQHATGVLKLRRVADAPVPAQGAPAASLDAVVSVDMVTPDGRLVRCGSGTVVDPAGVIVTNAHVVAAIQACAGATGVVGTADAWDAPLQWQWAFECVTTDADTDIAVLRVSRRVAVHPGRWRGTIAYGTTWEEADGGAKPAFAAAPLGDSAALRPLENLTLAGFPGLGGRTLTVSRTSLSGVTEDGHLKFSAPLNSGGSGGALFDGNGCLVGVPSHTPRLPSASTVRHLVDGKWTEVKVDFDPHAQPLNHAVGVGIVKAAVGKAAAAVTDCSP